MERKNEKRSLTRQTCCWDVTLRVVEGLFPESGVTPAPIKATIIDVNDNGVGLQTDTSLKPGQQVQFLEGGNCPFTLKDGAIMWSIEDKHGYRVGVMFS